MNTREKGREGETIVAEYLQGEGYRILRMNFISPFGEVDVIAEKDGLVAFIEVKSWSVIGWEDLERSVNQVKKRRILNTSRFFLMDHPEYADAGIRYDIAFVEPEKALIYYIPDAFTETDAA